MITLTELDLEFDFSDAENAIQYDQDSLHGRSTMKRVDFIAEYANCYRFIEVKDPDAPNVSNSDVFKKKLKTGALINSLAGKYRDSLLFRALAQKHDKDIEYIVLIAMQSIDPVDLMNNSDQLYRSIPIEHRNWSKKAAVKCVILNLEQYKKRYGEHSVRRISEGIN
jgi:hypothetical protein